MPELPEVEVVRRGLADHVTGRTIAEVAVLHPRAVRRHAAGALEFAAALAGGQVVAVHRRGKYLWFALDDAHRAVLAHLGMSGQLLLQPASAPDEAHLRIRFRFTDGDPQLRFVDQRTFGGMAVVSVDADGLPGPLAHIARDPLDPAFDDDGFARAVRRRRTGLKRALLDQSLVSGIGNIYADEALWHAKLHYARPTETLTRSQIAAVLTAARAVMTAALGEGGTSFDRLYVNVNGESGSSHEDVDVQWVEGWPYGEGLVGRFCTSHLRKRPSRFGGSPVARAVGLCSCAPLRPTAHRRVPVRHAVPDIEPDRAASVSASDEAERHYRPGLRMPRGVADA